MIAAVMPVSAPLGGESDQAFFVFFKLDCRKHTNIRTLCLGCHASVTRELRGRLKIKRKG
jgi:hypothetical protein